ncbi:MAG: hypothetical protein ACFCGT_27110 [Sandaracinaceae bacterium]
MTPELFELELLGGPVERRYRSARPEVEALPWGTLDLTDVPASVVQAGQHAWTRAAFQEWRTGCACALTVKALYEARAPVDLLAMATRFPLDELVHVELCSRLAMELGGAVPLFHEPGRLIIDPLPDVDPLLRCADLVVRFFCVGEALSIPMLRGTWHATEHPLPKAVLGRIVRDEAAHGAFGWLFLDWADELLREEDRAALGRAADETVRAVKRNWAYLGGQADDPAAAAHALGWMETRAYRDLAERSLERNVLAPLRKRGIPVTERSEASPPAGAATGRRGDRDGG